MKRIFIILALCSLTTGFAQEDRVEKTVTTKTTVKSSKGEDVAVKKQKLTQKEKLELENNNETNQTVTRKPHISESTTFSIDKDTYSIKPDKNGYVMMKVVNGNKEAYGKIRKMPDRDFYILNTEKQNSFGYFDRDGNFVVESYDPNADAVVFKKFMVEK